MSYSNSYPTQNPVLNLNFATGSDQFLDSRLSYSRSSTGTYMSNEKALNSENLLKNSQDYSSVWGNQYITTPTGSQTAPDGSSTAFRLTATSEASAAPTIYQAGINLAATTHTAVVHLKAGTASHGFISIRTSSGNSAYAMVDFSAGTVSNNHFGTTTNSSSTVTALGSDWFKITLTATSVAANNGYVFIGSSDGTAPDGGGYPTWTTSGQTIFVWGAQLSTVGSKVYDSPTTTQISREYSPLLKTASANEPRFEYAADGQSVGTALGLLVESQATNYNTKSEDIAGWSAPGNMTVSANAMVAPNGTLTADVLTVSDDTVASGHFAYNVVTGGSSGDSVAVSFYAKSTGVDEIYFYDNVVAGPSLTIFNISNGTVSGANSANSKITDCGNGWYHCVGVYTLTASNPSLRFYSYSSSSTTYIGNGYDGFALWGVQVEIGVSSESSYISTSGSTVSRAADSCSVALSDVGITSGQDLTAVVEGDAAEIAGAALIGFDDGSSSNYARILRHHSNNNYTFDVRTNASSQAVITLNSSSTANEFAFRLEQNNIGASAGGSAVTTDTSATLGLMTTMQIGNAYWGTQANGAISRVSIYSAPLTDTNLTALTSNP